MSRPPLADYISADDLATELHCSRRTIFTYTKQPDGLPPTRIAGRLWFHLGDVEDFLKRRRELPPQRRTA